MHTHGGILYKYLFCGFYQHTEQQAKNKYISTIIIAKRGFNMEI